MKLFPSIFGEKIIIFQVLQHCAVHYFWSKLLYVLLRFLRKPRIHTLAGIRNKPLNETNEVYLNFFVELTFILLSAFWIRMLSCLLPIVILLFVQVFKGCICIIYIEVTGILDLFCVTWKHFHLQTFHVFF